MSPLRCHLPHFWSILAALVLGLASANTSTAFATPTAAILKADSGANSAAVVAGAGKELKNTRSCKALCAHCGCFGFYCGEECICECNGGGGKDITDAECIATMQTNARKQHVPFELLIQGPSANRFIRNARQFEQNVVIEANVAAAENAARNKRATVVIYKPPRQNSPNSGQCAMRPPMTKKPLADVIPTRHKRSVGEQVERFNDLANTEVLCQPIDGGTAVLSKEDAGSAKHKRYTDEMDPRWFSNLKTIPLFPAPQFKRHRNDKSQVAVSMDALSEDLSANQREHWKAGSDVFSELPQNSDLVPIGMRNRFGETMSQLRGRFYSDELNDHVPVMAPVTAAPQPVLTQEFVLPWFRPVRFLERLQQYNNREE